MSKNIDPEELLDAIEETMQLKEPHSLFDVAENIVRKHCEAQLGSKCYMIEITGNKIYISSFASFDEKEKLQSLFLERNLKTTEENNKLVVSLV